MRKSASLEFALLSSPVMVTRSGMRLKLLELGLVFVTLSPVSGLAADTTPPEQTLPTGATISVRTIERIDSKHAELDHGYAASLAEPIMVSGVMLAPSGASALLQVQEVQNSGVASGRTVLRLTLSSITVERRTFHLETAELVSSSGRQGKRAALDVGVGTAAGAGIGAATAGPVGAVIGAGIGAAGGLFAAATHRQRVRLPAETRLTFTLTRPVSLPVVAPNNKPTLLGSPRTSVTQTGPEPPPPTLKRTPERTVAIEQNVDGIRVQLEGCRRNGNGAAACGIQLEMLEKDTTIGLNLNPYNGNRSFVVDSEGMQQYMAKAKLGSSESANGLETFAVKNVPVHGELEFASIDPGAEALAMVNLWIVSENQEHQFVFRDIPLARN